MTKQDRKDFDASAVPRNNYLQYLTADARKYKDLGVTEQCMFSFTTDIWNPSDRSLTRPALEIVQEHGLGVCGLTKGGRRALEDISIFRPDRDAFASTLTSLDTAFSRKWERNAADPDDRIATLKAFHDRGVFTWVSLEPTLDTESSLSIVDATHGFVDLFKIGRANYVPTITNVTDWREYTLRMLDKVTKLGIKYYFKKDLQPFLPPGTHNPLRIPQHH